jgi:transposase InsO family protein
MDIHKNARSCPQSRELLARRVLELGWSLRRAAGAAGLSERRGREWLRRAERDEPMSDRSSRPHRCHSIEPSIRARILRLRRERMTTRRIARIVSVGPATVARVCRAEGLGRLDRIDPPPPPRRYELAHPGELVHFDIKRLGRFNAVGHRITRTRSRGGPRQGWEFVHVAIDDASRLTYAEVLPDQLTADVTRFLEHALAWFRAHGIVIQRIMTDNGSSYCSHRFAELCQTLRLGHTRIKPYSPRTNGKVERVIQTLLREWAYRFVYRSSAERKSWLAPYLHFYNLHRAHSALDYNPPISRLDRNNVLRRNS